MNDEVPARPGRRAALRLLAGAGAALGALRAGARGALAAPTPPLDCIVTPEILQGPFFVDEHLHRSDVTGGAAGVALQLTIRVFGVRDGTCAPLHGAQVDLWSADAAGRYSDLRELGTAGRRFLRGYQIADAGGTVSFRTIYPGWYPTRAPHVHVKVRTSAGREGARSFATQLFFEDAVSETVFARAPYAAHGRAPVVNARDDFFDRRTLVRLERAGEGYAGSIAVGLKGA